MGTQSNDSLEALINSKGLRIGLPVVNDSTGLAATVSTPVYIDSSSKLAQGNIPFAFPLSAGATDTSFAALNVVGSATLTADDIFHQTLVKGSSVTTFAQSGFIRVNITDNAGNITNGNYYIQFGTVI